MEVFVNWHHLLFDSQLIRISKLLNNLWQRTSYVAKNNAEIVTDEEINKESKIESESLSSKQVPVTKVSN